MAFQPPPSALISAREIINHHSSADTLVGQGPKLMSEIDMVGSDLGYSTGTCGKDGQGAPVADAQPTLRIPSVVIGGKIQ